MQCAYTRHIYACGTKSPQGRHPWCNKNIICKSTPPLTIHLCKSTPPFTFQHMTQYDHDTWTYNNDPIMHNSNITTTNDNIKVHLQLHWLSQQHLHYQVFMSTHSTKHKSNKSHHNGSTYININSQYISTFHILHKSSKVEQYNTL
jgi:hypothetical protein